MAHTLVVCYLKEGEELALWNKIKAHYPGKKDKEVVLISLKLLDQKLNNPKNKEVPNERREEGRH